MEDITLILKTRPLSNAVGTEILDFDMAKPMDDETVQALTKLWAESGLLLFKKQKMTPEQHITFARRFGESAPTPGVTRYLLDGYPQLFVIANRDADGNLLETRETARQWHSDHSFKTVPCTGSVLYCRQMPPVGGNTMYTNMYKAYDALSDGMKAIINNCMAVHDLGNAKDLKNRAPRTPEEIASAPPVAHNMVITHPLSGRKALYVSECFTDYIEGLTKEESTAILDYLFQHSVKPEFTYRHQWDVDDVLMWDNRAVMHFAPRDYEPNDPAPENWRYMLRATIDPWNGEFAFPEQKDSHEVKVA